MCCQPRDASAFHGWSVTIRKPAGSLGHVVPGGGGAVTVIVACPDTPSLVAVTTTCPAATPVTTPDAETLATAEFELAHVTTRPVSTLPLASRVTAVSCTTCPVWMFADDGVTVTEATGALLTMSVAPADTPSLVAVMFVVPAPTAVA